MRLTLLVAVCLAFAKTSFSQVLSPLSEGIGGAGVANVNLWGAGENPASFGINSGFKAQAYGYSQTQIAGLDRFATDIGFSNANQSFSGSVQFFDAPGYTITGAHLGAGRKLGDGLFAGIRVGAVIGDYEEYGTEFLPVAQLGVQYNVANKLSAGAHYTYVERAILPLAEHRLKVGIDYRSSPKVHVLLSIWQTVDQRLAGGLGIMYIPADRVTLRVGLKTGAPAATFSLETQLSKGLSLALGVIAYQQLPVGVSYGAFYN